MRHIFTYLILLLILGSSSSLAAQNPQVLLSPQTSTVNVGDTVKIDVTVKNFTELASLGFNVNRTPAAALQFLALSDINTNIVPGFSQGAAVNGTANTVVMAWVDAALMPHSIPDDTRLFRINYLAVAPGNVSLKVDRPEAIDANLEEISVGVQNASVTIMGEAGGTPLSVTIGGSSGSANTEVCVPVTVSNFTDIRSMQFILKYDPAVLDFTRVSGFNLADLDAADFDEMTPGNIMVSWSSSMASANGVTVANGTKIFDVCFNLIGTSSQSSPIEIVGTPNRPIEVIQAGNPINLNATAGSINITGSTLTGVGFFISTESVEPGESVCVEVTVQNFAAISGLGFNMQWDGTVIKFDEIRVPNPTNLRDLTVEGNFNVINNRLIFSWTDMTAPGTGVTLPDNTLLFQVCFDVIGELGESSAINFTGTKEVINSNEELEDFNGFSGEVRIEEGTVEPADCATDAFPVCAGNATAEVGEEVCVTVTAQNFDRIQAMAFSINWNPALLKFERVDVSNSELPTNVNHSALNNSTVRFIWEDVTALGVTLPDDARLFRICFTTLAEGISAVSFSNGDVSFNDTEGVFKGSNGSVTIATVQSCPPLVLSNSEVTDISCNGAADGAITINVSGGNNNYTYSWQGPNNFRATTKDISGLAPGNYTVAITSCGPSVSMNYSVDEPSAITLQPDITRNISCFGETNGAIDLIVAGGTAPFTYAWSNSLPDQQDQTGLAAGTYQVTVTDANGCTATATNITITGPTAALAADTTSVTHIACAGTSTGAIDIEITGGTPAYNVRWNDNNTQVDRTGLAAGTYSFTVTDANNCTTSVTGIQVVSSNIAVVIADSTITEISGEGGEGAVDITVAGGDGTYNFSWQGPSNFTATTEDISGITIAGTYCVTVTDGRGCSDTQCFSLAAPLVVSGIPTSTCNGVCNGAIDLNVVGGIPPYTYRWNDGSTEEDRSSLCANIFTVTVTDSDGVPRIASFTIAQSSSIVVNQDITNETGSRINNNGAIALNVTGGTPPYDYLWSNNERTATIDSLDSGDYTVTITDANGCSRTQSFTVGYTPSDPTFANIDITNESCNGQEDGAISFVVRNGDPNYSIDFGDGFTTTLTEYNGTVVRTGLAAGTYNITITDANGGRGTMPITVGVPDLFNVDETIVSNTNPNNCNGQIRLVVTGGNGNYQYTWNEGSTSRDLLGLCAGTYRVTISDGSACVQVETFTITLFNAEAVSSNAACPENDASGSIDLTVVGGAGPFRYLWTDEEGNELTTLEDLQNVDAGTYSVRITEASGNSITRQFTIGSDSELDVEVEITNFNGFGVSCNGGRNARLIATGLNSTGYIYTWTANNQTIPGSVLDNVGAGTYTITVRDNVCSNSKSIAVTEPPALDAIMDLMNIRCNGDGDGEAMIFPSGGIPISANDPYTYTWSHNPNNNFQAAIGLDAGEYTVTVTDKNGCILVETFVIEDPVPLIVNVQTTPFDRTSPGSATANVSGGTPPYSYRWQPGGSTQPSIEELKPGNYSLTVTDMGGCERVLAVEIVDIDQCLKSTSVLTPNGDGANDIFKVSCNDSFSNLRLEVYSRWGQLVYAQDNYDNTWEGTDTSGSPLPEGAYYYVLQYETSTGQVQQRKGAVTLLLAK